MAVFETSMKMHEKTWKVKVVKTKKILKARTAKFPLEFESLML